jgi:hypothetical protein
MDTQNSATAEVPSFKLAKVGKERNKRRRGGLAGLFGGGPGSSGGGLNLLGMGGAGAGAGGSAGAAVGMSFGKILVALLITAGVSSAAWQFGSSMAGGNAAGGAPAAKKLFDSKASQKYSDLSGVIKGSNAMPNSLGYVEGSLDGLTPEERAKKQAEAAAAAKAQAEADKKAAAEQAAKEAADAKAAKDKQAADGALNGGEGLMKKGLGPAKPFKKMNSFFGGGSGLSGGAGLAGGINRNFAGASSLGQKLEKPQNGSMASFRHQGTHATSRSAARNAGRSTHRGFARRQLDKAFALSHQASSAGKAENAADTAGAAFDNNPAGGSTIAGPGVGNGAGAGVTDATTPNNPDGLIGNGGSATACGDGQYADANGNCQTTNTGGTKNATQWQGLLNMAMILLGIASLLSFIMAAFKDSIIGSPYAAIISAIIIGIGAVVAGIGVMLMTKYGQKLQGGILTAVGGGLAVLAYMSNGFSAEAAKDFTAGYMFAAAAVAMAGSAASAAKMK